MTNQQQKYSAKQLSTLLEKIRPNFAYEMIILQIGLFNYGKQTQKTNKSQQISQLSSFYMMAVQNLQGRFNMGFKYFNQKIQSLMKKRQIVQELFKSANLSIQKDKSILNSLQKAERKQRKQQYTLKMSLSNTKFDHNKVKQFIKHTQHKINLIECKIKTEFMKEQQKLTERIKLRRQRSQMSINGDDLKQRQIQFKALVLQNEEDLNNKGKANDKNLKKTNILNIKKKLALFSSFSGNDT